MVRKHTDRIVFGLQGGMRGAQFSVSAGRLRSSAARPKPAAKLLELTALDGRSDRQHGVSPRPSAEEARLQAPGGRREFGIEVASGSAERYKALIPDFETG